MLRYNLHSELNFDVTHKSVSKSPGYHWNTLAATRRAAPDRVAVADADVEGAGGGQAQEELERAFAIAVVEAHGVHFPSSLAVAGS